jgi:hypothetical protein
VYKNENTCTGVHTHKPKYWHPLPRYSTPWHSDREGLCTEIPIIHYFCSLPQIAASRRCCIAGLTIYIFLMYILCISALFPLMTIYKMLKMQKLGILSSYLEKRHIAVFTVCNSDIEWTVIRIRLLYYRSVLCISDFLFGLLPCLGNMIW